MNRKAIIISIGGFNLTLSEKKLIKKYQPWGIILFKRNIKTFNQTKNLIKTIREVTKDKKFPIMIDEEGGMVCRLSPFLDNKIYSQRFFANLFNKNRKLGLMLYQNYIKSMGSVFKNLGININTVPVLDLLSKNTSKVIDTRSYSNKVKIIRLLGKFCINKYNENKISTVMKHIPGHGCANSDSHLKLPVVKKNLELLKKEDFKCFKGLNSRFAMTAHILYKKIDSKYPATHSEKIINKIIRKFLKFKGIIISDDISMKALKYDIITNAKKSLKAGCNLVLHCSGNYNESLKLLKEMPLIDDFTRKKTSEFYNFLG